MGALVRQVCASQDGLGEAPLWHAEEGALYWSDHVGCVLRRLVPATGAVTTA